MGIGKKETVIAVSLIDKSYRALSGNGEAIYRVLTSDVVTNRECAQKRAASHNKFFKYSATVEEKRKLFAGFLEDMDRRGVKILLYVPPVTSYYRNHLNDYGAKKLGKMLVKELGL